MKRSVLIILTILCIAVVPTLHTQAMDVDFETDNLSPREIRLVEQYVQAGLEYENYFMQELWDQWHDSYLFYREGASPLLRTVYYDKASEYPAAIECLCDFEKQFDAALIETADNSDILAFVLSLTNGWQSSPLLYDAAIDYYKKALSVLKYEEPYFSDKIRILEQVKHYGRPSSVDCDVNGKEFTFSDFEYDYSGKLLNCLISSKDENIELVFNYNADGRCIYKAIFADDNLQYAENIEYSQNGNYETITYGKLGDNTISFDCDGFGNYTHITHIRNDQIIAEYTFQYDINDDGILTSCDALIDNTKDQEITHTYSFDYDENGNLSKVFINAELMEEFQYPPDSRPYVNSKLFGFSRYVDYLSAMPVRITDEYHDGSVTIVSSYLERDGRPSDISIFSDHQILYTFSYTSYYLIEIIDIESEEGNIGNIVFTYDDIP